MVGGSVSEMEGKMVSEMVCQPPTPKRNKLVIDLSSNNSPLVDNDLQNIGGVIVKLTEGTGYIDPVASAYINIARRRNVLVAGYHFFHPEMDLRKQADLFTSQLKLHNIRRGFVDCELDVNGTVNSNMIGPEWNRLKYLTLAFMKDINHLGYTSGLYTDLNFYLHGIQAPAYPLWIAAYPFALNNLTPVEAVSKLQSMKPPAPTAVLWQYTDNCHLPSQSCDASYYYGTKMGAFFNA